jgi:hypothetical protein
MRQSFEHADMKVTIERQGGGLWIRLEDRKLDDNRMIQGHVTEVIDRYFDRRHVSATASGVTEEMARDILTKAANARGELLIVNYTDKESCHWHNCWLPIKNNRFMYNGDGPFFVSYLRSMCSINKWHSVRLLDGREFDIIQGFRKDVA